MEKIKDVMLEVIKNISERKEGSFRDVQGKWRLLAGKKIAKHTAVTGIQNGRLLINVDSPAWLFQLALQKNKIEMQFKRENPEITGIHFRIGKVQ